MRKYKVKLKFYLIAGILFAMGVLSGCASAAPAATEAPAAAEEPAATEAPLATEALVPTEAPVNSDAAAEAEAPAATQVPQMEGTSSELPEVVTNVPYPTSQAIATTEPTSMPVTELRVIELEWPGSIRIGDADVIRMSLIPSEDGYTASAEYDEHLLANQQVDIKRPQGYTLSAVARLDGVGFDISPAGNQQIVMLPNETVTWRWSISPRMTGQQRISIFLLLHWQPDSAEVGQVKESVIFDQNLEIKVISFMGLRKSEAMTLGFSGLMLSGVLGIWAASGRQKPLRKRLAVLQPSDKITIESASGIRLEPNEKRLFQALFSKYDRLILKNEFLSGYSGARSFLAHPVYADGQTDAETIIKIGPCQDIENEYNHYESYVKDRLPPVTARIQSSPVTIAGFNKAALQYTCISEPGKSPSSLRQALLSNPDPAYIQRLFDTFGPNWWMQRKPHTFCLAEEYDRLLPPHYVLEPSSGTAKIALDKDSNPDRLSLRMGDLVTVSSFEQRELRRDGRSMTLFGVQKPGMPASRFRWMSPSPPRNSSARVIATRNDLLLQLTEGFDLAGLPNPLTKLDGWLHETINGTRSVIHGDLNLENVLVGPGNLVWLIDFAQTREGHPLYDFSHLACECIAHVIGHRKLDPKKFISLLEKGDDPLLARIERIAGNCLFNPSNPREYRLALVLSSLGGLKYHNLTGQAKQLLFLAAAYYGQD